jgi:hypothetical protein
MQPKAWEIFKSFFVQKIEVKEAFGDGTFQDTLTASNLGFNSSAAWHSRFSSYEDSTLEGIINSGGDDEGFFRPPNQSDVSWKVQNPLRAESIVELHSPKREK